MRSQRAAWWFVAPALIVLGVFFFLPVLARARDEPDRLRSLRAQRSSTTCASIGFENYGALLREPLFWKALGNTLYFVVLGVPLSIGALARRGAARQLEAREVPRPVPHGVLRAGRHDAGRRRGRLALHLPHALRISELRARRRSVSIPIDWMGDPHWAMPAIVILAVWKNFGYNMIILLAALQNIPEDLYEAARIDGASRLAAVPSRHAAGHRAGAAAGQHPDDDRLLPVVRRAVRDDGGRAAAEHA